MQGLSLSQYRDLSSPGIALSRVVDYAENETPQVYSKIYTDKLIDNINRGIIYQDLPEITDIPNDPGILELEALEEMKDFLDAGLDVLRNINTRIDIMLKEVKGVVGGLAQEISDKVNESIGSIFEGFGGFLEGIKEGIERSTNFLKNLVDGIKSGLSNIVDSVKGAFESFGDRIKDMFEVVGNTIRNAIDGMTNGLRDAVETIKVWFRDTFDRFIAFLRSVVASFKKVWNNMVDKLGVILEKVGGWIKTGFNAIVGGLKVAVDSVGGFIRNVIDKVVVVFRKVTDSLRAGLKWLGDEWRAYISEAIEGLRKIWEWFITPIDVGEKIALFNYTDIVAKIMTWLLGIQYEVSKKMYEEYGLSSN